MARKFISFEDVEQLATIEQLAETLGLNAKKTGTQLRCACPIHGGDDRALAISPNVRSRRGSLGVFFCQSAQEGGDRIGLVAHCMDIGQQDAAFFIAEQFGGNSAVDTRTVGTGTGTVSKKQATVPQREEGRTEQSQPAQFDPEKFASKLVYSDEVKALGFSEQDAARLGCGWHTQRKKVYFALRNPDGSTSGFVAFEGKLTLPPKWIESAPNVVRLRRA